MPQEVVILRGITGSGKTYAAREYEMLTPDAQIVSDVRGLIRALEAGAPMVLVDAPNIRMHEVAALNGVAQAYDCDTSIETHFIDPFLARRNKPDTAIEVLLAQYAHLMSEQALFPSGWNHIVVTYGGSGPLDNTNELELIGQKLVEKIHAYRERETIKEDTRAVASKAADRAADENYTDDNEDFG